MSEETIRLFRSNGHPGFSDLLSADPRRVFARKIEHTIQVEFATAGCTVQTTEGVVHARPGDAILTGIGGERWRVSREHFGDKYQPVPPTRTGESGSYRSLPNRIVALPMSEPFQVLLADGKSRLSGSPGDWLVDYGDGSLGIVSRTVFPTTYDILG